MRQLLNSQGPLTEKYPTTIKELIEEFSKHSREYHDPQEDKIRGYKDGHGASDDLAAVMEKLESMDRRMKKMDQINPSMQFGLGVIIVVERI